MKAIAVYSENQTKTINVLYVQNAWSLSVTAGGTHNLPLRFEELKVEADTAEATYQSIYV
jgi:hypothetical protein